MSMRDACSDSPFQGLGSLNTLPNSRYIETGLMKDEKTFHEKATLAYLTLAFQIPSTEVM